MEWILWSPLSETGLLVIPEEAEVLIPLLQSVAPQPHAYLMTYAAPVTKNMMHFNSLRYFSIPSLPEDCEFPKWFRLELGLFAGRLYASFEECLEIAEYLQEMGRRDGAGDACKGGPLQQKVVARFSNNPIGFALEWLALRRQVQDILQTPMGYICKGTKLHPGHPFFKTPMADGPLVVAEKSLGNSSADTSSGFDSQEDSEDVGEDEDFDQDFSELTEDAKNGEAQDDQDVDWYGDLDM